MLQMIKDVFQWKFDVAEFRTLITNGLHQPFPRIRAKYIMRDHSGLFVQITIAYLVLIFAIKRLMRDRKPFDLSFFLMFWNNFLAFFSIYGSWVLMPVMWQQIQSLGLYGCGCEGLSRMPPNAEYLMFLTVVSKAFELIDTIFLVLRKRPLIFLHWYHHVATFLFFAFTYPTLSSQVRVGAIVNLFVHAFMYTYYFLRAMEIRLSTRIAMTVTSLQLTQFVCFIYGCSLMYYALATDTYTCDTPLYVLHATFILSISYFALFINFFYKSYIQGRGKVTYQPKTIKKVRKIVKTVKKD
uniref:Elongation of very long chain fatty acids protein n=1 Tax=Caenorhabditis japonica TaxID=281687 RepID=A0A8R1E084_CAEJA